MGKGEDGERAKFGEGLEGIAFWDCFLLSRGMEFGRVF